MRGRWWPNRTANIDPHSYGRQRCVFLVLQTAQPEAQRPTLLGDGFLYYILSATSLDPNSSGPQRPQRPQRPLRPGVAFFYHILSAIYLQLLLQLIRDPELYNSSTTTQSPTRSLEWHVWSSSSRNNCHAVHRSLSSGASVYECTMRILACPILLTNFRPHDFLS